MWRVQNKTQSARAERLPLAVPKTLPHYACAYGWHFSQKAKALLDGTTARS